MIKVLIIDDEPIVRKGIKQLIPWKENGFVVCDEASDYVDGINKIKKHNPEIVLTDINMPGGYGIDLIRETIENNLNVKFIIISGYSSFEYAKQAIKYGVKSYILKPIDKEELLSALIKLKNELDDENILKKNKSILKELELEKYILNKEGNIEYYYNMYNNFKIALIDYMKDDDGITLEGLKNIIKEKLLTYDDIDVIFIDGSIGIVFKGVKLSRIIRTINDLYEYMKQELRINTFIALGETVERYFDLGDAYNTAKKLINKRFIYLEKGIIYDEILENEYTGNLNFQIELAKVFNYIEVNNLTELKLEFEKIRKYIIANNYTEQQTKISSIRMFLEIEEKLSADYNISEIIFINNEEFMKKIHNMSSLKEVINYLVGILSSISKKIGTMSSNSIIKRVINYIDHNYYQDLKLEVLAEIFNYNSAYLGKLFKETVGENFNTYLDKIRIEKAKKLLLQSKYKVYQVCEKVGYKNIDYFHRKFKKYVGTSPLNYKKQNY